MVGFQDADALERLESMDQAALDGLSFGVVGFGPDGATLRYNEVEERNTGLSSSNVLGQHFFHEVAPCMNNYLVAERFWDEPALDETIPYVLTFRMKPTKARIRMLRAEDSQVMYLLIEREG